MKIIETNETKEFHDGVLSALRCKRPPHVIALIAPGGTGKSVQLKRLQDELEYCIAIAPTGRANANIGGNGTLHKILGIPSFKTEGKIYDESRAFGFGARDKNGKLRRKTGGQQEDFDCLNPCARGHKILKKVKIILLDEFSMCSAFMIDCLNRRLQQVKRSKLPFGGVQIIMFGDPFQFKPVVKDEEWESMQDLGYEGINSWNAKVFEKIDIYKMQLSRIFRQKDQRFALLLNRVRLGTATSQDIDWINTRVGEPSALTPHACQFNHISKAQNNRKLRQLSGQTVTLKADIRGLWAIKHAKQQPLPPEIKLVKGCKVMIISNGRYKLKKEYGVGVHEEDEFVEYNNGDLATFIELDNYGNCVLDRDNELILMKPKKFPNEKVDYDEEGNQIRDEVGSYSQYPIAPGYAFTSHKLQGATLDSIHIDTGGEPLFCEAMGYVTLGRCTSIEGITLDRKLTPYDLRPPQDAIDWMDIELVEEQAEFNLCL